MAFATTVVYWPGARQFSTMPKWSVLAVGLALALCVLREVRLPIGAWMLAVYSVLSMLWAPLPLDAVNRELQLVMALAAVAIGAELEWGQLERVLVWMSFGVGLSGLIALAEMFGFKSVYLIQITVPSGLFGNRNVMAEAALPLLVWTMLTRRWLLAGMLALAALLPVSRAVIGAIGLVAALGLWRQGWRLIAAAIPMLMAVAVGYAWTGSGGDGLRLDIWLDSVQGSSMWGRGIGQYYGLFPLNATHIETLTNRVEHAHNEWIELGFELGLPGLACAAVACWEIAVGKWCWQSYCLLAVAIDSCFGFPLREPTSVLVVGLLAGSLWTHNVQLRRWKFASTAANV